MVSIEKLLTNEEFIKWVKNPTKENDLFWSEWLKSNPDKVNDVNRAKDLIHQFNFRKATKDDERFNRVLKNILLEKDSPKQQAIPQPFWSAIKTSCAVKSNLTAAGPGWGSVSAVMVAAAASLWAAATVRVNMMKRPWSSILWRPHRKI